MTPQEKKLNQVEARVSNLETKFEAFMQEMRDFKAEMRDRDNQRAEDIREIRTSLDGMNKYVQSLTVTAMVGVGASVIAVVVLVGTTIYALLSH